MLKKIVLNYGEKIPSVPVGGLLLGTFDGVHRGHQQLILEGRLNGNGPVSVLLFDDSPARSLNLTKRKEVLTSLEDKLHLFYQYGVEQVFLLSPAKDYYKMEASSFIENVLKPLGSERLICGEDYRFGKGAVGTPSLLKKYFKVDIVPLLSINGKKASTQTIGDYLKEGEIEKASQMLGRYYSVKGKVISGFHNGRIIGFPTMNLSLSSPYLLPKIGVYFSLTWVNGKPYRSITNVGNNPTVGLLNEVKIETHLLGFKEDAYGKEVEVQFLSFLREEITFSSLEDLALQLKEDQEKARKLPFPSLL